MTITEIADIIKAKLNDKVKSLVMNYTSRPIRIYMRDRDDRDWIIEIKEIGD